MTRSIDADHHHGLHTAPWHEAARVALTLPLVLLAIPSVIIGFAPRVLDARRRMVQGAIHMPEAVPSPSKVRAHLPRRGAAMAPRLHQPALLAGAMAGVASAWFFYELRRASGGHQADLWPIHLLLENKYSSRFNEIFIAGGARLLGKGLGRGRWHDDRRPVVNGRRPAVGKGVPTAVPAWLQTGHIYQYAFVMIALA